MNISTLRRNDRRAFGRAVRAGLLARRPSTTIRRRPRRRIGRRSVQAGAVRLRRELGTAEAQIVVPVRGARCGCDITPARKIIITARRTSPVGCVELAMTHRSSIPVRLCDAPYLLQMSPGGEGYALFNSLAAQSVVFPRPGRCARRVAVSGLLRTLRLATLPRSAHDHG